MTVTGSVTLVRHFAFDNAVTANRIAHESEDRFRPIEYVLPLTSPVLQIGTRRISTACGLSTFLHHVRSVTPRNGFHGDGEELAVT